MDWVVPTVAALAGLGGIFLGHWLSQRATDRQWKRTRELQIEEWQREDARRWDTERREAYSTLWAESLNLVTALGDLTPYWERGEEAPQNLMRSFEDRRDKVAAAHARAKLLASKPVRARLFPLWNRRLRLVRHWTIGTMARRQDLPWLTVSAKTSGRYSETSTPPSPLSSASIRPSHT